MGGEAFPGNESELWGAILTPQVRALPAPCLRGSGDPQVSSRALYPRIRLAERELCGLCAPSQTELPALLGICIQLVLVFS